MAREEERQLYRQKQAFERKLKEDRDKAIKTLELLISHSESDIVVEKCKKLISDIKQL